MKKLILYTLLGVLLILAGNIWCYLENQRLLYPITNICFLLTILYFLIPKYRNLKTPKLQRLVEIMKTNKDLIFAISNTIWLFSNILSFIFYNLNGVAVSNFVCILLFGTMTIIKIKNKTFSNWLEHKLNNSKQHCVYWL